MPNDQFRAGGGTDQMDSDDCPPLEDPAYTATPDDQMTLRGTRALTKAAKKEKGENEADFSKKTVVGLEPAAPPAGATQHFRNYIRPTTWAVNIEHLLFRRASF